MYMSDEFKGILILILFVVVVGGLGYLMGHTDGYWQGREDQLKDQEELDCRVRFGRVEYSRIEGECIKYFVNKDAS